MKVISWNVNGLRASLKSPGGGHKTLKDFLDGLGADIICFQETKATRTCEHTPLHVDSNFMMMLCFFCAHVQEINWMKPCTWWMDTMLISPSAEPGRATRVLLIT